MIATLQFEWLKFSKRWMPRIILLMVIGLLTIAFWGNATRIDGRPNLFLPRAWLAGLEYSVFFAAFFWPVLGGSWAGNEYGWGTIRTILTRRPYRIQQVLSGLVVLTAGLAMALVAIIAVCTIGGILVSAFTGHSTWVSGVWSDVFAGVLLKGFLTAWFVSTFYLLLAYSTATIFRSPAVGIGVGIGGTFAQLIVGEIFRGLGGVWNTIALHFPFAYSQDMITQVVKGQMMPGTGLARVDPTTPSAGQSLAALTIYGAILLAITLWSVRVRDVTD